MFVSNPPVIQTWPHALFFMIYINGFFFWAAHIIIQLLAISLQTFKSAFYLSWEHMAICAV